MIGIIWYYTDIKQALEQLKIIQRYYEYINIKSRGVATSTRPTLYFDNDDIWRVCRANKENAKIQGRCNISYIEYGTPTEIITDVIRPSTKAYPFSAFNYYGGPSDGINPEAE